MQPIDLIIIFGYLIGITAFGIWYAGKQETTEDYFVGYRSVPWWAIAMSIVVIFTLNTSGCVLKNNKSNGPIADMTMKEISYRGGVVVFSIPSHWKEEYNDRGDAMFYEASANTGTLRLNVLTFASPNSEGRFEAAAEARDTAVKNGGESFELPDGKAMARYDSHSVEDGEPITLRFWQVYSSVSDSHARIAVFSYTLPSARLRDEKHAREIEMLDREIRNARFAKAVRTLE